MSRPIAASTKPIILLGAGQASAQEVTIALRFADRVVAADGGACLALEAGVLPDLVVGDFDSLPEDVIDRIGRDRLHHIEDQNRTDFQKGLSCIDAPLILGVGFLGGRLDHQLAALSAVLTEPRPVILIGGGEVVFVARGQVSVQVGRGQPVALYPLVPVKVESRGMVWDVDGTLSPKGLISTSNEMAEEVLELTAAEEGVLVILPEAALPEVIAALS